MSASSKPSEIATRVLYLVPTPSADVAREKTAPKMRFLYPLAAVCLAVVFLAPSTGHAQTPKLRADQQKFIEMAIAGVEPAYRAAAYEQMAKTVAPMSEQMIAMAMTKAKTNKAEQAQQAKAEKAARDAAPKDRAVTPEDRAYHKAQYEPVIRKHHAVQKKFDAFVNAKVAAYCPGRDTYARFGSGWRYEQGEMMMESALATWNVETNVTVAGEAYAPTNGRYNFDFSKVRMTYDEKAVDAAIKSACDQVHVKGKAFLAKVDPIIARKDWDGAFKAEGSAQSALDVTRQDLKAKLDPLGPGDFSAIQMAMMNGKRVS